MYKLSVMKFFFFQAEDGIRDDLVTGVQTCALPIWGMEVAVRCRQLRKTYDGGFEAVRGLDLEIRSGECFGLLGPNGAGKTTTIEILEGLLDPTSGRSEERRVGKECR